MKPAPISPLFRLSAEDLDHILAHTEAIWTSLRGSRFFITGGTGFFGKWLLASLAAANDRLDARLTATVLSRDPQRFLECHPELGPRRDFQWLRGDIRDFAFPAGSFPLIIHAATAASEQLNVEQPRVMFDTIADGTRRLLDFAAQAAPDAMLLTSSGAVYGPQPPTLSHIPEDFTGAPDPLSPHSAYGEGKRVAEFLCTSSGLPAKIARCFAFIGPYLPLDAHFAAGNFIRDALRGGPIIVRGDGRPLRSYLYAADLVVWLLNILARGQVGHPYNVGSPEPVAIAAMASLIGIAAGGLQVNVTGAPTAGAPPRYVPDTSRVQTQLGLRVNIGLENAVARHLAWCHLPPHRAP